MSNSGLVTYTRLSPNHSGKRVYPITRITVHHMAGVMSVEGCGSVFANSARQASSNYGIDSNGGVGLYVDESNRSWASSSYDNDNRAVTIEVSNCSTGGNWPVSDTAYNKLIDLCADICKRNGKNELLYMDKAQALSYAPKSNEMVLTMHQWFASTACPGPYLKEQFSDIAKKVTTKLRGSSKLPASKFTATGMSKPSNLTVGSSFVLRGQIVSINPFKRVEVGIVDSTGKKWITKYDKSVSGKVFNVGVADSSIRFGKLKAGTYYYRIWCHDGNGAKMVMNHKFSVVSNESKITFSGETYPTTLKKGKPFAIKGLIKSNLPLKRVEIGVVDSTGKKWTAQKYDNKSLTGKTFNISNADPKVKFGSLAVGSYYYRIWAHDTKGAKKILDKKFKVVK